MLRNTSESFKCMVKARPSGATDFDLIDFLFVYFCRCQELKKYKPVAGWGRWGKKATTIAHAAAIEACLSGKMENGHKNVPAGNSTWLVAFHTSVINEVQQMWLLPHSYPPVLLKVNPTSRTSFSSGILVVRKSGNVFSFLISSAWKEVEGRLREPILTLPHSLCSQGFYKLNGMRRLT